VRFEGCGDMDVDMRCERWRWQEDLDKMGEAAGERLRVRWRSARGVAGKAGRLARCP